MLSTTELVTPDAVMVLGAWCRDIQHLALGHTFPTTATMDLDLALALRSWDAYSILSGAFPKIGDTGIRHRIADIAVDLIPFGEIEEPPGVATRPKDGDALSVWAFERVFDASLELRLRDGHRIRIPTVAGYAALKLGAWLDRSEWLEGKDATDLALVLHWMADSPDATDRLYDTVQGNDILLAEEADIPLAAAHLLGVDVAETIGARRLAELADRWPGDLDLLIRELRFTGGPPMSIDRRHDLIAALTRGLMRGVDEPDG